MRSGCDTGNRRDLQMETLQNVRCLHLRVKGGAVRCGSSPAGHPPQAAPRGHTWGSGLRIERFFGHRTSPLESNFRTGVTETKPKGGAWKNSSTPALSVSHEKGFRTPMSAGVSSTTGNRIPRSQRLCRRGHSAPALWWRPKRRRGQKAMAT